MNPSARRFLIVALASLAVLVAGLSLYLFVMPPRVLTRLGEQPPLGPLYAFWAPALSLKILRPVLAVIGYVFWFWVIDRGEPRNARATAVLLAAQVVWLALLAQLVAGIRLPLDELGVSMTFYAGEDFWDDLPQVQSPSSFLTEFSSLHRRDRLSLHGKTHPPGHTLFLWTVARVIGAGPHGAALAILAVGSSGIVPVFLLARRVFGERIATRVRVLYPVMPCVLLFAVSSSDFLFAGVAAWSLWLAVEAVLGRRAVVAVSAGLVVGVAAMFSVAEMFVVMLVGLFVVACWIDRRGAATGRQLAVMAAGGVGWFAALQLGFNFDYLECLQLVHRFHDKFIEYVHEVDGGTAFGIWAYTSFGHLLAFGSFIGLPVVAGLVQSVAPTIRRGLWSGAVDQHFVRASMLVLAVMMFGGLFVLEVERIWLFMVGPIAIVGCSAMPEFADSRSERLLLAACIAASCAQCVLYESLVFTIW